MAQMTSEIILKNELRPCIVNGQKALFHKWAEKENFGKLYATFLNMGGSYERRK